MSSIVAALTAVLCGSLLFAYGYKRRAARSDRRETGEDADEKRKERLDELLETDHHPVEPTMKR